MRRYKLFSLFSGAGGIDLGFALTDRFVPIFANDVLAAPAGTYSHYFGHQICRSGEPIPSQKPVYLISDICDVDFNLIGHDDIDVMVGGPPCQDFSIVRGPNMERKGIDVNRGRLYAHFVRALINVQPKIFIFENVPGLKSANSGSAYKIIIEDFQRLGLRWNEVKKIIGNNANKPIKNYRILFSDIIDTSALGVPQRRRRLIILGIREDIFQRNWLFLESKRVEIERLLLGHNSLFKKYPLTAIEAFEGKTIPDLQKEYRKIMEDYSDLTKFVDSPRASTWQKSVWEKLKLDIVEDYIFANKIKIKSPREMETAYESHASILKELEFYNVNIEGKDFFDGSNTIANESETVFSRMQMIPPDENWQFVKGTAWQVEGRGMSLIYRRLHPLKPAYTVVAYGGGGTWGYHYRRNRSRLTNRERARLQTFPDYFPFIGSVSQVRAQIGEAIPPLVGKRLGQAILSILDEISF